MPLLKTALSGNIINISAFLTERVFWSEKSHTTHSDIHGKKGFVIPTKSLVKIGITKIFCYNNKMFGYQQNVWLLRQNFWLHQQKNYLLSLILLL